ncbi:MAG: NUDIX hydrolase [Vicinamibacterales bacterium]
MAKEYPAAPVVGVGGVIVRGDRALIVRRAQEPRKGEWSLPGGVVELGETLEEALRREISEETGLSVEVGALIETFDRIHRDGSGRVRYHFVIVDYLCLAGDASGEAVAATDVDGVAWVGVDGLDAYGVNAHAAAVLRKGLALARAMPR